MYNVPYKLRLIEWKITVIDYRVDKEDDFVILIVNECIKSDRIKPIGERF